jgi:hypothetical protein
MALNPISSVSSAAGPPEDPREKAPFIANVGGKTYVANVNYSAGEYTAEDPVIFGAVGDGPTMQAAEEEFANRLNLLA